jgi:hypothetical protein
MNPFSCGADTPVRETPALRKDEAGTRAISAVIVRPFRLFLSALREIFDESAYRRFLDRTELQSSVGAYAAFQKENELAKSRRPRCC